jgi:cytochrome c551/c552
MSLLRGLAASVTASAPGASVITANASEPVANHYATTLSFPRPGNWMVTIHSGFGPSDNTLLPIRAIASTAAAPAAPSEPERGLHLFVAKGCVTCHVHGALAGRSWMNIGPELTGKRYVADYVAKFLADPASSPLSKTNQTQWQMPNLGLKPPEIASLVAFLNYEGQIATQTSGSKR